WTLSVVFLSCVGFSLVSLDAVASDSVLLDRSSWVDYEAPAHGYAFKGPADWHSSYPDPATSHEIIILRHPSSVSGCGLVYVPAAPGTTIDIESYIEYMTDSQVIEMASFKYSSVRLLYRKQGEVS